MTEAENRMIDTLTKVYCREGYPFEGQDKLHRVHIEWEFLSGQWLMLTDKHSNRLLGWISFYLTDEKGLNIFKNDSIEKLIVNGIPIELTRGEHIYIATTVVMPWAPQQTYRKLFNLVAENNQQCKSISANLRKRNKKTRWVHRIIH